MKALRRRRATDIPGHPPRVPRACLDSPGHVPRAGPPLRRAGRCRVCVCVCVCVGGGGCGAGRPP